MSTKLLSAAGLTCLVTGASSGIGRLLALRFARDGARLILVARRREELERLRSEIEALGGEALVLPCDVGKLEDVRRLCSRALDEFGVVDILVNNAGYGHHRPFVDWDIEDQENMMRVNYLGMMYFAKLLLPKMIEHGRGWVVFMASVAGKLATPDESAYAASKFATVGLAEALSLEVEDAGVHVLTVCPGAIRTPFFDAEALERMPPVAKRGMVDPEKLVDVVMRALRKGQHEVTYPYGIVSGYIVRALAPTFMRRQVKRVTLGAMKKR
jgi:short-subunit dehydrogenase